MIVCQVPEGMRISASPGPTIVSRSLAARLDRYPCGPAAAGSLDPGRSIVSKKSALKLFVIGWLLLVIAPTEVRDC